MVMRAMREGAFAGFFKYVILSFIALSVLGLVLMDVSGAFSNNISGNRDVAIVEGNSITLQDFDRRARIALGQSGISPQQAYQIGYLNELLAQEVRTEFVLLEAKRLGINLSNEQVKMRIAEEIKPMVQQGQTLQQTLDGILQQQQMTDHQFVEAIRKEMTTKMLVDAVHSSFKGASENMALDMLTFQGQTRDIDLLILKDSDIKDVIAPTEDQLQSLYEAYKNTRFKIPEYRLLKVGVFDFAKLPKLAAPSDQEVEEYYNAHLENFAVGEQKIVTQILSSSEEDAKKIADMVQGGKTLEDAYKDGGAKAVSGIVKDMRLEVEMMFPEMRKALETAEVGKVVGPIKTPLGFHIMRLEGSEPATTKPFAAVKDLLKKQMTDEKNDQAVYDLTVQLEDHFAAGERIKDVEKIAPMAVTDLPVLEITGLTKESKNAFESVDKTISDSRDAILKTGFEIALDDPDQARIIELKDGNYAIVELVSLEAETSKLYDSVKDELKKQFEDDQRAADNSARVQKYLAELSAGTKTLAAIANETGNSIQSIDKINVLEPAKEPLNEEIKQALFNKPVGSYVEFQPENAAAIVHIKGYALNPVTEEQKKNIPQLLEGLNREMRNEAFVMYLQALGKRYDAATNDALLKRAYGQAPQTDMQ